MILPESGWRSFAAEAASVVLSIGNVKTAICVCVTHLQRFAQPHSHHGQTIGKR
jgi:hypothetical protein